MAGRPDVDAARPLTENASETPNDLLEELSEPCNSTKTRPGYHYHQEVSSSLGQMTGYGTDFDVVPAQLTLLTKPKRCRRGTFWLVTVARQKLQAVRRIPLRTMSCGMIIRLQGLFPSRRPPWWTSSLSPSNAQQQARRRCHRLLIVGRQQS